MIIESLETDRESPSGFLMPTSQDSNPMTRRRTPQYVESNAALKGSKACWSIRTNAVQYASLPALHLLCFLAGATTAKRNTNDPY